MRRFLVFLSSVLALVIVLPATQLIAAVAADVPTSSNLPPLLRDVGIDQKLNSQVPLDLVFRDESGSEVTPGSSGARLLRLSDALHNRAEWCAAQRERAEIQHRPGV